MTTTSDRPWPDGTGPGAPTKDVAHEQAAQVKDHASHAGEQVLDTAKDQAIEVATDAKAQARDLLGRARGELGTQASTQRDRAVQGLQSLATQLQSMAESGEQSATATQLARQGSQTTEQVATFLAERDPSQLVEEIRCFARRRPAAFLLGAAMAGVVAGRLTRGVKAASSEDAQEAPHAQQTGPGLVGG